MNTISAQMDAQIRARADKLRSFYHQSDVFKKWLSPRPQAEAQLHALIRRESARRKHVAAQTRLCRGGYPLRHDAGH